MLKALKTISAAVLAAASISVHASSDMTTNTDQGFYLGLKTGAMDISFPRYDADTPLSIQGGYAFGNGFAAEVEYTKTDFTLGSGSGDLSTLAAYAVYRTPGDFYGKFKAGILSEELTASNRYMAISATDSGLSAGVGVGYRFNDQISAEFEYTLIEADVNFLSLGINYHF